ncbi:MAG: zinc ribbon domain-containing protein [Ilumatobacteraceae bacterium]
MDLVALAAVQAIDTALDQARHARPRLPEVIEHQAAERDLVAVRAQIADIRRRQSEAQRELDGVEESSAEIDAHRSRLERQMKTIIAPREAEALQHELHTLATRRGALDDRGLELLEASSAADEEIAELSQVEVRAAESEARAAERRAAAEADADARIADMVVHRNEAVSVVSAADVAAYDRQRAACGGVAVTAIAHGKCGGCHMEISKSELDAIKRLPADEVAECPSCARWLVR